MQHRLALRAPGGGYIWLSSALIIQSNLQDVVVYSKVTHLYVRKHVPQSPLPLCYSDKVSG